MPRILGVDLGLKRTGLAVSDELLLTARGLPTLSPRSRREDIDHLLGLVRELEVSHVVIGHPRLPRSGDEGPMAKRARGFADALAEEARARGLTLEVVLVDEAGSSKAAAARLVDAGVKRSKRKELLDAEVACGLVLELADALRAQRPA